MRVESEYRIEIDSSAWRELMKLPEDVQSTLSDAIYQLQSNPRPSGCKKLEGESGFYRIRAGNYRVIYDVQDQKLVVVVVKVGKRDKVYK